MAYIYRCSSRFLSLPLLARINHNPPRNRALLHPIIHALQFAHPHRLERTLNQPSLEEIQRLRRIEPVAHIRPLDRLHLDHGLEDGRFEVGVGGQADGDDGAAGTDVFGGLLERFLAHRDEEDGVRARAVLRGRLHVLDQVRGCGEIHKGFRAEPLHHLRLLVPRVDGDDAQAHRFRELAGQRAEPASGADDGDALARFGTALLQPFIDGDAGAEDGGDGVKGEFLGDTGDVGGFADGVLLKGAVDGVAGEEGFGAEGFIAGLAEGAGETGSVEPLLDRLLE